MNQKLPETKEEFLAYLESAVLGSVSSWGDFYDMLSTMFKASKVNPAAMFDLFFTMYSFFLAMKELPDEGNIEVLVKRPLAILVMEGEEGLGIVLQFANQPQPAENDMVEKRLQTDLQSLSLAKSILSRVSDKAKKDV